jgi:ADP-ribosyl-[dinitrogen reductase] hydrolase
LTSPCLLSRFRGCLLAGAVGDALGAPVEFSSLAEIQGEFGPRGPENLEASPYPAGSFTDDTQMTLFVAEGLIRALNHKRSGGIGPAIDIMLHAHWRWLTTQGLQPIGGADREALTSWLTEIPGLNQRRAPGRACISSLQSGELGTRDRPINDGKGCGGVMRIAPVGLAWPDDPFDFGCEAAALTHGHPTGWLAAGCLAVIIHEIVEGASLDTAVERAMSRIARFPGHEETLRALEHAEAFAAMGQGTPEEVEGLGQGWIAEEALAISVFCAQVAPDLESALRLAVTHSGDSDSTGSITGHILGALHGVEAIPQRWLDQLDLKDVVDTVATDLYRALHETDDRSAYDLKRYPEV